MRKLDVIVWIGALGVSVFALGCSSSEPKADDPNKGAGLMPVTDDPKERLDEERFENASRGLKFEAGRVTVLVKQTVDRKKAVLATAKAEKSLDTENTWFKAAGMFRDAILLDPSFAPPYEGFARALLLEGRAGQAEAMLRTAVALDPGFSKARFELGTVRQMSADYSGALAEWKTLVSRDPSYPDAYARMAIASYFDQDFKSAWAYLGEADKRKQNVPPQFRGLLKEVAPRP